MRDVADVQIGHEIRRGAATADGRGEVVLGLGFMLMGENPHEVTWALKDKLESSKSTCRPTCKVQVVYDRTELVDHVIQTVRKNLFEGGLLVIAVLFGFLGNLRAALIVALAIPLSMLFAFSGMLQFGISASLLSLGAIDFGMIVDSSVVMVENCVRHIAHGDSRRRSLLDVIRDAAVEVRRPDDVRRADHYDRLPADPDAGRHRREAVPAHGVDGDLCPGRLDGAVVDADARTGQPAAAAADRRARAGADAGRQVALCSGAARGHAP